MKFYFHVRILREWSQIKKRKEIVDILGRIGQSICGDSERGTYSILNTNDPDEDKILLCIQIPLKEYMKKLGEFLESLKIVMDIRVDLVQHKEKIHRALHGNYLQMEVISSQPNRKFNLYNQLNPIFAALKIRAYVENTMKGIILYFETKDDFDESLRLFVDSTSEKTRETKNTQKKTG